MILALLLALPLLPLQSAEIGVLSSSVTPKEMAVPPMAGDSFQHFEGPAVASATERILLSSAGKAVLVRFWSALPQGQLSVFSDTADDPVAVFDLAKIAAGQSDVPKAFGWSGDRGLELRRPVAAEDLRLVLSGNAGAWSADLRKTDQAAGSEEDLQFISNLLMKNKFVLHPRRRTVQQGRYRPNERQSMWLNGEGTVHSVQVILKEPRPASDADFAKIFRGLRFKVFVERSKTPIVDVPFGDVFGLAPGIQLHDGYFTRVPQEDNQWQSFFFYLPMPFEEQIMFHILNECRKRVFIETRLIFDEEPPAPWRLHGAWQQIALQPGGNPVLALDAKGPARLVAWSFSGRGLSAFSLSGGCLGPDGPLSLLRRTDLGLSGYRFYLADAPFVGAEENLRIELPFHAGEEGGAVSTLAWWYAPADALWKSKPLPGPDVRELAP